MRSQSVECLVLLLVALLACSDALKLELASVIFRHGDRSPTHSYPNDPYQESYWPQGFGQLSTEGMRQEYFLGEVLKYRYIYDLKLINSNYTRTQVYIRSTDYDRTLMSGESLLAGLFPPSGNQVFTKGLPWQPIPLHTVPAGEDNLLLVYSNCPTYTNLLFEDTQTPPYINLNNENKDFFKALEIRTGLESLNLTTVHSFYDTLNVEKLKNLTLPEWANSTVMAHLLNLTLFTNGLYFNTETKQRLTAGNWIGKVLSDMKTRIMDPNNEMRLYLYSAHDTVVAAMMTALGVFNGVFPPYAATFAIELYSNIDSDYFVALFYQNETYGSHFWPLPVSSCSNITICTLQEFMDLADPVVPTDWEEECGLASSLEPIPEATSLLIVAGMQGFVVLVLLIVCSIVAVCVCYRKCEREPQYIRLHRP